MTDDPPEYVLAWLRRGGWTESDGEWSHSGLESPDVEVWEAIEIELGRNDAPIIGTCPGCGPEAAFDLQSRSRLVRVCRRCGYEEEVSSQRR
jgi:hypothetical protein